MEQKVKVEETTYTRVAYKLADAGSCKHDWVKTQYAGSKFKTCKLCGSSEHIG